MKPSIPVIVFADVDHTFLTIETSRTSPEAEDVLASEGVTLVLCSSMTRAQLEVCQQELGIRQPFICESGAAVLVPHGYFPFDVPNDRELTGYHVIEFGGPYAEVVTLLHRTAMRLGIRLIGFADLSVEQVASECGLSLSKARLAKLREYDEPFRLANVDPEARDRLWRALHATRLGCTHHASYEHVGAWVDKGASVTLLTTWYRRALGTIVTVGLGTAANSAALLHRVTLPFVAEAAAVGFRAQSMPGIPRLHVAANRGAWLEAILDLARRARKRRGSMRRASAAG